MKDLLKYSTGLFFLSILCGTTLFSCAEKEDNWVRNYNGGPALGTSYNIVYLTDKRQDFQRAIDSVFEAVNTSMSTYLPGSDISKINQGDSTIVVDAMFKEVFELSKEVYHKTDGYFDPTVGVLVDAWGFGPGAKLAMDSTKVDSLMRFVGFNKVALHENGTILKEHPQIRFDFNAIAKGYAIDRLARMLDRKGVRNYLIEVGGEVVARGINKGKEKEWVVGIDDPQSDTERQLKISLKLKDKALASSGNYRKFWVDSTSGKKYVHTIDPKTGFTKNGNVLATTVIANTCAQADAYATAFMALELEESVELLDTQKELEVYIIYLDETGKTMEFMTTGFENLVLR